MYINWAVHNFPSPVGTVAYWVCTKYVSHWLITCTVCGRPGSYFHHRSTALIGPLPSFHCAKRLFQYRGGESFTLYLNHILCPFVLPQDRSRLFWRISGGPGAVDFMLGWATGWLVCLKCRTVSRDCNAWSVCNCFWWPVLYGPVGIMGSTLYHTYIHLAHMWLILKGWI